MCNKLSNYCFCSITFAKLAICHLYLPNYFIEFMSNNNPLLFVDCTYLTYLHKTACDHVGLCTVVSSSPSMIDSTPPQPGKVFVKFFNSIQSEEHNVVVKWDQFLDPESGIRGYEVGVGSYPHSQDASSFKPVAGSAALYDGPQKLTDGKYYYFQIKVF